MASYSSTARTALVATGVAAAIVVARTLDAKSSRILPDGARAHRVVIVGAGFGGLAAATALTRQPGIDLCVIDQHNHHLFQPLLYQVATAALGPDDISTPIRDAITTDRHARVVMATVTGIDLAGRRVLCDGQAEPFDSLVLATGSRPSYFGHEDWARATLGLKTLADALSLRQHILRVFERANDLAEDDPGRTSLLTFVLIGGGATGVEMAGSIAELARDTRLRDYDDNAAMQARVILVEAGPYLLAEFAHTLSRRAAADLSAMGVQVRTGTRVTGIEPGTVHLGDDHVAAETVIWTAGVEATPVAGWLGIAPAHGGRVSVGRDLTVAGHSDVYVIGDAADARDSRGRNFPGLAPVAKQQGAYVARAILGRVRGRSAPAPFTYSDYGTLATIGRNRAVAEFGQVHLTGFVAWITWAVAHIFFLIGFRNRVLVSAQWLFSYLTHQRGGRVITGTLKDRSG